MNAIQDDRREALQIQVIANELRDRFKGRVMPTTAAFLISGLIADLTIEAKALMEPRS